MELRCCVAGGLRITAGSDPRASKVGLGTSLLFGNLTELTFDVSIFYRDIHHFVSVICRLYFLIFYFGLGFMMSSKSAPLANPRHPLQRYESPSKGFSGALHVSCIDDDSISIKSDPKLGCWSHKFLPRVQIVRKH